MQILMMVLNNGETKYEKFKDTQDISSFKKTLENNPNIFDYRFFVEKDLYDYEVKKLEKAEEKISHIKYVLSNEWEGIR